MVSECGEANPPICLLTTFIRRVAGLLPTAHRPPGCMVSPALQSPVNCCCKRHAVSKGTVYRQTLTEQCRSSTSHTPIKYRIWSAEPNPEKPCPGAGLLGAASGLCRSALCISGKPRDALHTLFLPRDGKNGSDRKTLYPSVKAEHGSWTLSAHL